jgi:hypothetical protein
MHCGKFVAGGTLWAALGVLMGASILVAEEPTGGIPSLGAPGSRTAGKPVIPTTPVAAVDSRSTIDLTGPKFLFESPAPGEHPYAPALRWAYPTLERIQNIDSYTCKLVKRERVDGQLGDYQYAEMKVRHQPFSVYMQFLSPYKGTETLYVEGENDGLMWAHPGEAKRKLIGTISLDPAGARAMKGNRYPLTEAGILNLVRRMIEVGEEERQYGECELRQFAGAKVNGRSCSVVQFTHPVPRKEFRYHRARVFVDDQLGVPIRFEAYAWPEKEGAEPPLTEEYTYLDLRLNAGLSGIDFDINNPEYTFK